MSKTKSEIENTNLRDLADLCDLVEHLGYNDHHGTYLSNGSNLGSLMSFFSDNPGALTAVHDFILQNLDCYEVEEEEETDEDDEGLVLLLREYK